MDVQKNGRTGQIWGNRIWCVEMKPLFYSFCAFIMLMLCVPYTALAQDAGGGAPPVTAPGKQTHIKVLLQPEMDIVRPGDTVMLAFIMRPDTGWHGYWKNPGDAGYGMQAKWTLPDGVTAGELQYPVPKPWVAFGLMNYVFEEDYAVLVPVKIDTDIAAGQYLDIAVALEWLACTDKVCVPESGTFQTSIVTGNGSEGAVRTQRFDALREKLPAPLGSMGRFAVDGDTVRIAIPYPENGKLEKPYFFPATTNAIDYGAPMRVYRNGQNIIVEAMADAGPASQLGELETLQGVLKIAPDFGLGVVAEKGSVTAGGELLYTSGTDNDAAGASEASLLLLAAALGGAVLGGLLLNIMPCVFPILSLKAISLAKIGGDEHAARREAIAYTIGVMLVCVALGAVMLGLRAAGEQVGWAFQLQDARVVFVLLLVVTAIAFNLAGLFEIGTLAIGNDRAASGGTPGAFWTGALAAFVATPCTGPFMAVAMGSALVLPPLAAMLVFAGLGLGLALPFLALGFIPALRQLMPKPGAWMETFRKIMSLPMFLTALALLWLMGQLSGSNALVLALMAAMLLAFFLWWAGQRQRQGKAGALWIALPLAGLALAGIYGMSQLAADTDTGRSGAGRNTNDILPSEPYSATRLAQLRAEGRAVFAYFTADWCVTCKVNEAAAIEREETAKAFTSADIAVLKGDWTRRDAEITRYLEANGRSGVPLYVYYPADGEPQILPQILTPGMLADLAK